jgi:hypothetical protein
LLTLTGPHVDVVVQIAPGLLAWAIAGMNSAPAIANDAASQAAINRPPRVTPHSFVIAPSRERGVYGQVSLPSRLCAMNLGRPRDSVQYQSP